MERRGRNTPAARSTSRAKPVTIDDYLAAVDADKRRALEKLRTDIKAAMPRAEECISYGVPALRLDGKVIVWFAAATRHCSFFPGAVVEEFTDELKDYDLSKGTIRFQPSDPLPARLVRTLVKARIARMAARPPRAAAGAARRR